MNNEKKVLFFRDFKRFSGGHQKVWDYFNHFNEHGRFSPAVCFTKDSVWDANNPWLRAQEAVIPSADEITPDILFLAGLDWLRRHEAKADASSVPIINLIQHVRHGDPQDPRHAFLKHKAIRICVSEEVADAIRQTRTANGPVYAIPNGIDLQRIPQPAADENRDIDLLLLGLKRPQLAQELAGKLRHLNKKVMVITDFMPQERYFALLGQAKVAVFLPNLQEGFYLPALEAMCIGTLVVCPDCLGNRSFCLPDYNCFRPQYGPEAILNAINAALASSGQDRQALLANARQTAAMHSLQTEREEFFNILDNLAHIW